VLNREISERKAVAGNCMSRVLWVLLHEDGSSGPLLKMAELGFLFVPTAFVLFFSFHFPVTALITRGC
jgi:hypothetical protein